MGMIRTTNAKLTTCRMLKAAANRFWMLRQRNWTGGISSRTATSVPLFVQSTATTAGDAWNTTTIIAYAQTVEAVWGMDIASFGMRMNDETDEKSLEQWVQDSFPFMLLIVFGFFVFLIAFGLFCYHVFLITTNQSSWEHAKRSKITYLKDLPLDVLPFSQGALMNIWLFLRGRPRNVWTYNMETKVGTTLSRPPSFEAIGAAPTALEVSTSIAADVVE
ncbi:hypothetical protein H310_13449 [Aphanomyces invadans]|uniref:Uncharacterized protein n=1 Tax=Aphanomyces invadans TaxID=157072 RepID=A0A024TF45_9STRA|nr:hypothetical protein H310_13449 [Aphanomyces invadans]ETV92216.1 hypothetical protein H310_13449 [Aphanomyces invadans]|eukprot:XP_008879180.1 hypothetical protein H310_13449 [Aphanomyces invadans]